MQPIRIPFLEKNKSVITNYDYDEYNLLYAILRALFPKKQRLLYTNLKYNYLDKFNLSNINFPIAPKDLNKLVNQNSWLNIKLNVLYFYNNNIYPNQIIGNGDNEITVIFTKKLTTSRLCSENCNNCFSGQKLPKTFCKDKVHKKNEENVEHHFFLVKNADALLSSNYVSEYSNYSKSYFCLNCLCKFSSKNLRNEHEKICINDNAAQIVSMPVGSPPKTSFKKIKSLSLFPIVAYADLESSLVKLENNICENCGKAFCVCEVTVSTLKQRHEPISWSIIFVSFDNTVLHEETYTGTDCMNKFLEMLRRVEPIIKEEMQKCKHFMIPLTKDEKKRHETEVCWICKKPFKESLDSSELKCHDHSHYTGKYLGPAHTSCNLKRQSSNFDTIPIFFHGGQGYDFHHILKYTSNNEYDKFRALAKNQQRLRTLQINSFLLLDSSAHLPSSLHQLAESLKLDKNHKYSLFFQSSILKSIKEEDKKIIALTKLNSKGIYPYSLFETIDDLKNQTSLPDKKSFFNDLSEENVSDEDYSKASQVWEFFSCKTMLDYLELYLKTDVSKK